MSYLGYVINSIADEKKRRVVFLLWWFFGLVTAALALYNSVQNIISHTPPTGEGAHWFYSYLLAGLFLVFAMAMTLTTLLKRDIGCFPITVIVVYGLIYIAQVLVYLYFRGFHWMLLLPLMLVVALVVVWLLACASVSLYGLLQPKTCSECQELGHFVLTSKRPDQGGTSKRYCLSHFMGSLEECFRSHKGRFIIVAPQVSDNPKAAQYFYYEPDDMALDSYPQSDIETVKALLVGALSGGEGELLAVRIPSDAIKNVGEFDDQPLLTRLPDAIDKTPLDTRGVLAFIESELRNFDTPGREFRMNKPYADRGIYIWFNYT